MKKFILMIVFFLVLIGCGKPELTASVSTGNQNSVQNAEVKLSGEKVERQVTSYVLGTAVEKDGISITLTDVKIQPITGDRTQDNVGKENGEYFAIGSDIVKTSDYEQIMVAVKIENKSDKAFSFSSSGWEAKLPDGYKLKNIKTTGKIGQQMPSKYSAEGSVQIIKEKAIKAEKMTLTYNLMDYNEEWQKAIWDAISGKLDEKAYKEKFNPQPIEFELLNLK